MQTPEEEEVIIFENVCEINYYKHEHICVSMLIYSDVKYIVVETRKFCEDIVRYFANIEHRSS